MSLKKQLSSKVKPQIKDEAFLKLPVKEQEFILQYLMTLNASEAAIACGYKHPNYGATLTQKPRIKRFLKKFKKAVYDSRVVDVAALIEQINNGIQRDAGDLVNDEGLIEHNIKKLPKHIREQIDGLKQEYTEVLHPETGEVVGRKVKTELKLIPKAQMLRMGIEITGINESKEEAEKVGIDWDQLTRKPIDEDDFVESELSKLEAQVKAGGPTVKVRKKKGRPSNDKQK